ncbi:molybdopterin dehydrogenase [Oscillospiraceae bacterium]|nr:molybdopterin dehydrogenase [Oscillospiraceae bacterium]BDF75577.1 molybdopterin dehydrogenase [Oscillospiraceae bacterium]
MWQQVVFPSSPEEAAAILSSSGGRARVLGGGTDLIPLHRDGRASEPILVDVTRIPGFCCIRQEGESLVLGGAVTHAQAAQSPLLRRSAAVLSAACAAVGSPQIRNVATLSGNIVNAQPAADGALALIALDAQAEIRSAQGCRCVPVADLYEGVGRSRVDSIRELICAIRIRALRTDRQEASAVERLSMRRALALPMVNVAVSLSVDNGRFSWIRSAVGPVAQTPFRPYALERQAAGAPVTDRTIAAFAHQVSLEVHPRDSALRGSAEYRSAMVEVLLRRAITRAAKTALQGGESLGNLEDEPERRGCGVSNPRL